MNVVRTHEDETNDAERMLMQAMAIVDLLSEFVAPGGDIKQGAINLQELSLLTLHATLENVNELLRRVCLCVNGAKVEYMDAKRVA